MSMQNSIFLTTQLPLVQFFPNYYQTTPPFWTFNTKIIANNQIWIENGFCIISIKITALFNDISPWTVLLRWCSVLIVVKFWIFISMNSMQNTEKTRKKKIFSSSWMFFHSSPVQFSPVSLYQAPTHPILRESRKFWMFYGKRLGKAPFRKKNKNRKSVDSGCKIDMFGIYGSNYSLRRPTRSFRKKCLLYIVRHIINTKKNFLY